jgi:hypothetical protein
MQTASVVKKLTLLLGGTVASYFALQGGFFLSGAVAKWIASSETTYGPGCDVFVKDLEPDWLGVLVGPSALYVPFLILAAILDLVDKNKKK